MCRMVSSSGPCTGMALLWPPSQAPSDATANSAAARVRNIARGADGLKESRGGEPDRHIVGVLCEGWARPIISQMPAFVKAVIPPHDPPGGKLPESQLCYRFLI